MKFEMEFGWAGNEFITITTFDFEKIAILQEFINRQEETGWCGDEEDEDFDFEDEDTEEELEGSESDK